MYKYSATSITMFKLSSISYIVQLIYLRRFHFEDFYLEWRGGGRLRTGGVRINVVLSLIGALLATLPYDVKHLFNQFPLTIIQVHGSTNQYLGRGHSYGFFSKYYCTKYFPNLTIIVGGRPPTQHKDTQNREIRHLLRIVVAITGVFPTRSQIYHHRVKLNICMCICL